MVSEMCAVHLFDVLVHLCYGYGNMCIKICIFCNWIVWNKNIELKNEKTFVK